MRHRPRLNPGEDIPSKANRVLNLVLIGVVLIVLRVWHLSVIEHEERVEASRRPKTRLVIEPAKRGTIRDRFNLPLAINKVQYLASVQYSQIRQIPSIVWEKERGEKVKRYKRREYISSLSELLAQELNLDAERVEDLIHSKAALYNNLPYVIKEDISEQEYYRLKMLEKDWLGVHMQCVPKRHYPLGRVAGDIIGYTGAISKEQYEMIVQEIKILESCLAAKENDEEPGFPEGVSTFRQATERLKDLIEHAYSITDDVGKAGIERTFEEQLRGYNGKKRYHSDARGNFLKELPDAKLPLSGQRLLLTISAELQEFSEKLLIQNEKIRTPRVTGVDNNDRKMLAEKHPWIKGGAIVAMEPFSGEVLAMASFPRFDPNDFIASGNPEIREKKNRGIRRWFETEGYIAEIWDQRRPLEREVHDLDSERYDEEKVWLTWDKYLSLILPETSPVIEGLKKVKTVKRAVFLQRQIETLLSLLEGSSLYSVFNLLYPPPFHRPHGHRLPAVEQEHLEELFIDNRQAIASTKKRLDPVLSAIPNNYDKVLLIDLLKVLVDAKSLSDEAFEAFQQMGLAEYRQANAAFTSLEKAAKEIARVMFYDVDFKPWRKTNQKTFLKQKRLEEKEAGRKYAKPYLDLLDKKESEMFASFWKTYRWELMLPFLTGKKVTESAYLEPYFRHFLTWEQELVNGAHSALPWNRAYCSLKKTVEPLPRQDAISLMQSFRSFQELDRPLLGRYRFLRKEANLQLEKHLAAGFYPRYGYGYGRSHAYRQAATQGSIFKIITSYEALVQKYRKLTFGTKNFSTLNPLVMVDDTHKVNKQTFVGYDAMGKRISQLYKGGRIPRSHRSGIGKVDLLKAFEVSSNPYFSLLAVDHLDHPDDLARAAKDFCLGKLTDIDLPWEISGRVPTDLDCNRNGLLSMAIGQHSLVVTPLQTAVMLAAIANGGKIIKPKIVNMVIGTSPSGIQITPTQIKGEVFLPKEVREILLTGMFRVSRRTQNAAWGTLKELYDDYPEAISDLIDLKDLIIGKSSTAESVENLDLDLKTGTNIYNHTWFGGIVYDPIGEAPEWFTFHDAQGVPELVVVVYLKYGAWGKDTVPLAAQVAGKWREIKKKRLM